MFTALRTTLAATAVSGAALFAAAPAMAQVEIEYWQYFFDARVTAMETLIANFQEANPDITVTMTHFPYANYRTQVAAAIPAGEGPDIVQLFYGWLNDYIEAELIQPLPEVTFPAAMIEEEFFPMVSAMQVDGQYWALPTAVRSLALFYNTRLFEAAGLEGPPETLEQMVEYAQALTERDGAGNITTVGLTTGMTGQDHHWFREGLIRQFGGEPYTEDYRTVTYDSEAGREALQFYVDLEGELGVTQNLFMDEAQAAFRAGRAGMHIDGSFRIGALAETRGLDWAVAELPAGADGTQSNYASYWVNAITSRAEGPEYEASVLFMQYITSPEAMEIWLEVVGELPAREAVGLTEANASDPVYGPFIRGLEYAHATIFADETAQRQVLVEAVERVQLQGMSVEESLAVAAEAEQAILDSYYQQ